MSIIAIANQKGGVGKTTTAINLGAALIERGRRVLVVDFDPQASATTALGIDPEELDTCITHVMRAGIDDKSAPSITDVITTAAGIDLVPSDISLSAVEADLLTALGGEAILKQVLAPTADDYDYVLIDCLPSLGLLAINALTAADQVLVPVQAEYLPMKGLRLLLQTVAKVRAKLNPDLAVAGILLTLVEMHTLHCREVCEHVRSVFEGRVRVFDTYIKKTVRLRETTVSGESILTYAPKHEAADAYRALAEELEGDSKK